MSPTKTRGLSRWLHSRKLAITVAATMVLTPVVAVTTATAASAHTPRVSATCEALVVDLVNYAASQPGKDATDPVTKTVPDRRYAWNPKQGHHNEDGTPDKTGSTPLNDPSHWQANTSHYNGSDPVGEVFQSGNGQNSSWFFWTTKEVVVTPGHDAVAPKTNHVTVTIDGAVTADTDFSTSYQKSFDLGDKTVAHTYKVSVSAWDDPSGNKGWTVTESGTTTPCAPPAPTIQKDADGHIVVSDATCTASGVASWADVKNATESDLDQSVGDHDGVLTGVVKDGIDHRFADGTNTKTVPYVIPAQLDANDPNCQTTPPVVSSVVSVTQQCVTDAPVVSMHVVDADGKSHDHGARIYEGDSASGTAIGTVMFGTENDGTITLDITDLGQKLVAGEQYTVVIYADGLSGSVQDTATFTVEKCEVTPPVVDVPQPVVTFTDVCYAQSQKSAESFSVNIAVPNDGKAYGVHFQYKDGAGVENGGFADNVKGPNFKVDLPFDGTSIAEGDFTFTAWLTLGDQDSEHAVATVNIAACDTTPPVVTPPDFPAAPQVCAPAYTLPANTADFTWSLKEGHVIATRVADGATHDYGQVPLGSDCPTSPANPGDNGGGNNPPATNTNRTPKAPITGGVGDTGTEGILWGALALMGIVGIGGAVFGLRRRHA